MQYTKQPSLILAFSVEYEIWFLIYEMKYRVFPLVIGQYEMIFRIYEMRFLVVETPL
jgi:hypothetical protein